MNLDSELIDQLLSAHDSVGYRAFDYTFRGQQAAALADLPGIVGIRIEEFTAPAMTQVSALRFDAYLVGTVKTRPITFGWPRSRPEARRRYLYVLTTVGNVEVITQGKVTTSTEGGLQVVHPGDAHVRIRATEYSELVLFSFDRHEIPPFDLAETIGISVDDPLLRASIAFLVATAQLPASGPRRETRLLRELLREVARTLQEAASPAVPRHDVLSLARDAMEKGFRSPLFSAKELAAEIGVSRRTVERAFLNENQSVTDQLRRRRTQHALDLLLRGTSLDLSGVVAASGFGSIEAMRRSFWRYYGFSPASARRAMLDQRSPES